MLGIHSEPRRGQMSHICDISPLRVKLKYTQEAFNSKLKFFMNL